MDRKQFEEILKSSFLFNFRTGNVFVDTIVTGIIICFSTYLMNLLGNLQNINVKQLLLRWFEPQQSPDNIIKISGKTIQGIDRTRLEYSTMFFAVLQQIKKLDCAKANIKVLREIEIKSYFDYGSQYWDSDNEECNQEKRKATEANLIVSQEEEFKLADNVYGIVHIKQGSDNDKEGKDALKFEEFQIIVKSSVLSMDSLRKVVNGWVTEYQRSMAPDKYLRYFCYIPTGDMNDLHHDPSEYYAEFRFESGKTFDNVFFPEKDDIVKRLDFFANNKAWYKTRGIPYTMGFLLYGEPGCGKTSTIKAIANHTSRHIVSIPLNKINTFKELLSLFYNVWMNGKDIPLHRRLYVLEDIDADELEDVVADRATKVCNREDEEVKLNPDKQSNLLTMLKIPYVDMFDSKKHRLTLATLLEVLDGVMEMDGRIVVITTNYPERLDKALIRPGRIDIQLNFGRCTSECLVEMYEHFFQTSFPDWFDKNSLPDRKWTPAETTQVFLSHMHDPPQGLVHLSRAKPGGSLLSNACSFVQQMQGKEVADAQDIIESKPCDISTIQSTAVTKDGVDGMTEVDVIHYLVEETILTCQAQNPNKNGK